MSTIKANTLSNVAGTQSIAVDRVAQGTAIAWVRVTVSAGVPSVAANYNISSVTDVGVGIYTLNFTTSMPDLNYAFTGGGQHTSGAVIVTGYTGATRTTSTLPLAAYRTDAAGFADVTEVDVAVFR